MMKIRGRGRPSGSKNKNPTKKESLATKTKCKLSTPKVKDELLQVVKEKTVKKTPKPFPKCEVEEAVDTVESSVRVPFPKTEEEEFSMKTVNSQKIKQEAAKIKLKPTVKQIRKPSLTNLTRAEPTLIKQVVRTPKSLGSLKNAIPDISEDQSSSTVSSTTHHLFRNMAPRFKASTSGKLLPYLPLDSSVKVLALEKQCIEPRKWTVGDVKEYLELNNCHFGAKQLFSREIDGAQFFEMNRPRLMLLMDHKTCAGLWDLVGRLRALVKLQDVQKIKSLPKIPKLSDQNKPKNCLEIVSQQDKGAEHKMKTGTKMSFTIPKKKATAAPVQVPTVDDGGNPSATVEQRERQQSSSFSEPKQLANDPSSWEDDDGDDPASTSTVVTPETKSSQPEKPSPDDDWEDSCTISSNTTSNAPSHVDRRESIVTSYGEYRRKSGYPLPERNSRGGGSSLENRRGRGSGRGRAGSQGDRGRGGSQGDRGRGRAHGDRGRGGSNGDIRGRPFGDRGCGGSFRGNWGNGRGRGRGSWISEDDGNNWTKEIGKQEEECSQPRAAPKKDDLNNGPGSATNDDWGEETKIAPNSSTIDDDWDAKPAKKNDCNSGPVSKKEDESTKSTSKNDDWDEAPKTTAPVAKKEEWGEDASKNVVPSLGSAKSDDWDTDSQKKKDEWGVGPTSKKDEEASAKEKEWDTEPPKKNDLSDKIPQQADEWDSGPSKKDDWNSGSLTQGNLGSAASNKDERDIGSAKTDDWVLNPRKIGTAVAVAAQNDYWGVPSGRKDGWGIPSTKKEDWTPTAIWTAPSVKVDEWGAPSTSDDWGAISAKTDGWGSSSLKIDDWGSSSGKNDDWGGTTTYGGEVNHQNNNIRGRGRGDRGGRGGGRGDGRGGANTPREGDWDCPSESCGISNFAFRTECFKCYTEKPGGNGGGGRDDSFRGGRGRGRGDRGGRGTKRQADNSDDWKYSSFKQCSYSDCNDIWGNTSTPKKIPSLFNNDDWGTSSSKTDCEGVRKQTDDWSCSNINTKEDNMASKLPRYKWGASKGPKYEDDWGTLTTPKLVDDWGTNPSDVVTEPKGDWSGTVRDDWGSAKAPKYDWGTTPDDDWVGSVRKGTEDIKGAVDDWRSAPAAKQSKTSRRDCLTGANSVPIGKRIPVFNAEFGKRNEDCPQLESITLNAEFLKFRTAEKQFIAFGDHYRRATVKPNDDLKSTEIPAPSKIVTNISTARISSIYDWTIAKTGNCTSPSTKIDDWVTPSTENDHWTTPATKY